MPADRADAERAACPICNRQFASLNAAWQHSKAKHKGNQARAERQKMREIIDGEREESMADIFVEAQMNRAMGIPNDDWIEEMLP